MGDASSHEVSLATADCRAREDVYQYCPLLVPGMKNPNIWIWIQYGRSDTPRQFAIQGFDPLCSGSKLHAGNMYYSTKKKKLSEHLVA